MTGRRERKQCNVPGEQTPEDRAYHLGYTRGVDHALLALDSYLSRYEVGGSEEDADKHAATLACIVGVSRLKDLNAPPKDGWWSERAGRLGDNRATEESTAPIHEVPTMRIGVPKVEVEE